MKSRGGEAGCWEEEEKVKWEGGLVWKEIKES